MYNINKYNTFYNKLNQQNNIIDYLFIIKFRQCQGNY